MQVPQESDKTREFFCPCGKGYYSYAALFTHIKQKHDGKVRKLRLSHPDPSSNPNPNTKEADLERHHRH